MSRLSVIELPDPRLRQPCEAVLRFDDELSEFIRDLSDTIVACSAIGLSAPQVGDMQRIAMINTAEQDGEPMVFVNPQVLAKRRRGIIEESCLSVPGVTGMVVRETEIRVCAQDVNGATFERDLSQMSAVALLHEIDHLDGVMFIDRMSWFARRRVRRQNPQFQ
jgi:peptide deformylase